MGDKKESSFKFPYEIQELDPHLNDELMKDFPGILIK